MLQYIKKYLKGGFLAILLFFIFISFAFWGVGDIFRSGGSDNLGKIGEFKISGRIFAEQFQLNLRQYSDKQENKNLVTSDEKIKIANKTLNDITNRYLFLSMAKKMNLEISSNELKKNILNNELFHNELNGYEFDSNIYKNFVKRNFGSEDNYLQYLKDQITIELLTNNFSSSIQYPKNLIESIHSHNEEQKEFEIASIDKVYEQKKIKKPEKKILDDFFKANRINYKFKERRSFSYLFINPKQVSKNINIDEKEILDTYEERKEEYVESEKRKIEQLIFDDEQKAKEAYRLLNEGKKFTEIVEKKLNNNSQTLLGILTKEELLDEFSNKVYSLNIKEYTEPIKTVVGWHILKVVDIQKEKFINFDSVKDKIRKEIAEEKAYDEIDFIVNNIEDQIAQGTKLEEISNKLNLNLKKEENLEKNDFFKESRSEIFKNKLFYNDIFNKNISEDLFIVEIENGFFITRVDQIIKETEKNFDEAFEEVFEDWKKIESEKVIKDKVKKFNENINNKKGFIETSDELKIDNGITDLINRTDLAEKYRLPIEFVEKLFDEDKEKILEKDTVNKYYLVKIKSDKVLNTDNDKLIELEDELNKFFAIDNFQQLIYMLRKEFPVKINSTFYQNFIETLK